MSSTEVSQLPDALTRAIMYLMKGAITVDGIIDEVNDNFTVDVKVGEQTFYEVPMRVLTGTQSSIIEKPVKGTECLICFRDNNIQQPQLVMVNIIDELLYTAKQVTYNGGSLGGMVKVDDLVNRLNNIEDKYNDLVAKFNMHTHTGVTTGPGTSGPTLTQETPTGKTTKTQLENPKITQ